MTRTIE